MATIRKLDKQTINSIAAGEVIERPASVAKELMENALDAGASIIRLSIENGGIKKLSCQDDGAGMDPEDARLALESHATSKLAQTDDLFRLHTMGFRGEALPSIAAVSRVELRTRRRDDPQGSCLTVEGGEKTFEGPCSAAPGTTVTCRDLFFNTPARYKFLRTDAAETGAIVAITGKIALTRPDVSFRLERENDGRELLYTPGDNELLSAIYAVFGHEAAGEMKPVAGDDPAVKVEGFMTGPSASRHNRGRQVFMVNGRVIQSGILRSAVDEACKTWFMKGRFPQLVLKLTIAPNLVDINVHPQKTEVRFWEDRTVFRSVFHAIRATLEREGAIASVTGQALDEQAADPESSPPVQLGVDQLARDRSEHPVARLKQDVEDYSAQVRQDAGIEFKEVPPPAEPPKKAPARDESVSALLEARLIGTFLDTYILLDDGESLIMIDQHAAHERVLYERLLQRQEESGRRVPGQTLLTPLRIEVSQEELLVLEEEPDYFEALGFDFEPFGGRVIALRAVPSARTTDSSSIDPSAAFRAALDMLMLARQTGRTVDQSDILHQIACKAAVKANDRLSEDEIRILIKDLTLRSNPYHCPHGRPVALRMSRTQIEKMFGRTV
ncbi:MAG: DNA mismatch repair endonuclease MutL [Clostridiaceae bacterium]|nr:DNA mismatch repair endonuclease MutL [Clostridiaceae bacterium]